MRLTANGALRGWWQSAATRITLGFALRGSIAMLVPFIVLLELGWPFASVFAGLGGLNTVLTDTGGAYQRRFGAMLLAFVAGAVSLFIGARLPQAIWLAPVVVAVLAFTGGMARVFGGSGISIGLFASIMFLVGSLAPQDTARAAEFAGFYALGGLWVVVFHLAAWRLRPYRALGQQVAAAYGACAALVQAVAAESVKRDSAMLRRRHRAAREAIRAAEATFEAVRIGAGHSGPFLDRIALLLAAASREAVAVTSLRSVSRPAPGTIEAKLWRDLFTSWQAILAAISQLLLEGRGEVSIAPMQAAFEALEKRSVIPGTAMPPLRLALLHLNAAAEAGPRVLGAHFSWHEALPRLSIGGLRGAVATVAAQLDFRSIIFRHALRVAVAAGFGLWISGVFDVEHRLWLPMTTLIVLQPEFGATWQRLWQRIGGTLVGVLIAGGLHFLVHGGVAEMAMIAVFAFGTFFFIRGHYGIGVVMLTPMVLLLLGVLTPQTSGQLIVARGVDTVLGGVLAFAAAYLLWPLWQRGAFLPQCAAALRAERDYLAIAFALPGDGELSHPELMRARHESERASDNADATLRRMLSEPRRRRGDTRAALGFMTYLHRLSGNATRFAVELAGARLAPADRIQGEELLPRLDDIATVLEGKAKPDTLAAIRPQLAVSAGAGPLAPWFERFAADTAMLALATRRLLRTEPRDRRAWRAGLVHRRV